MSQIGGLRFAGLMAVAMTIAVMRLRCTLEERTRLNLSAPAGTPGGRRLQ